MLRGERRGEASDTWKTVTAALALKVNKKVVVRIFGGEID
jgi:hypothetical protein